MAAAELFVAPDAVVDALGVSMLEGLGAMRRQGLHCDVAVVSSDGSRLLAHRAVLAASSQVLRQRLAESNKENTELMLEAMPETVRLLVDFVYEVPGADDYRPTAFDVNREVLVLAKQLNLPGLTQRAAEWLAEGVTTANAVEKLRACREFGLEALHSRIIERLIADRSALAQVSQSTQIAAHPELMRALLQASMLRSTQLKAAEKSAAETPVVEVDGAVGQHVAGKPAEVEAPEQPDAEDAEDSADVAEQPVADASPEGPAPKKRQRKGRGRGAA